MSVRITIALFLTLFASAVAEAAFGDTRIAVGYTVRSVKGSHSANFIATLRANGTVSESHSSRDFDKNVELGGSRWKVINTNTLRRTVKKAGSIRTFTIGVDGKNCTAVYSFTGPNPNNLSVEDISCKIQ